MAYKQAPINFGVGTGSSPLNNEPGKGRSWENPEGSHIDEQKALYEASQNQEAKASDDQEARASGDHTKAKPSKSKVKSDFDSRAEDASYTRESALPFKGWFKKWRENRKHKQFLKEQREDKVRRRDKR